MHPDFWLERWQSSQIGFHQNIVHPDLMEQAAWFLGEGPHEVLVPLSGKSWDLPWLADQGHHVAGAELSEIAVRALFEEHQRAFATRTEGAHQVFTSGSLDVWQGDFFAIPVTAGPFDRVWDRAALVALPPDLRDRYVAQMHALAPGATVLLNAIDYDQSVMSGPPFAVSEAEVHRLFGAANVERIGERNLIDRAPRWRERGHNWFRTRLYRIVLENKA